MKRAANICIHEQKSERSVAENLIICQVSLNRYIKKFKTSELGDSPPKYGYNSHTRIFNIDQEIILSNYLKTCTDMYFGLSPNDVRKLAFEYAVKLNLKIPHYWTDNKCAGIDWFSIFFKRYLILSIR